MASVPLGVCLADGCTQLTSSVSISFPVGCFLCLLLLKKHFMSACLESTAPCESLGTWGTLSSLYRKKLGLAALVSRHCCHFRGLFRLLRGGLYNNLKSDNRTVQQFKKLLLSWVAEMSNSSCAVLVKCYLQMRGKGVLFTVSDELFALPPLHLFSSWFCINIKSPKNEI